MKLKAKEFFTLEKFNELKNIVRADKTKNEKGSIYEKDIFECDEEMFEYLNGQNKYKKSFVEIVKEEQSKEEFKKIKKENNGKK